MDTTTLNVVTITQRIAKARELQRQIEALNNEIDVLEDPIHVRLRALLGDMRRYAGASHFCIEGDMLHFTATFSWENDETEFYAIPLQFITEPDEEAARVGYRAWAKEQERIAANLAMQKAGAEREAKERAEFERLRAKFEGNVNV